jgi:hypothetical protein
VEEESWIDGWRMGVVKGEEESMFAFLTVGWLEWDGGELKDGIRVVANGVTRNDGGLRERTLW